MVSTSTVLWKGGLGRNSSVLWDLKQNLKQSLPKVRLLLWPKRQKASCVANDPPSPKFDLEASSFPPLPGCVDCIQGETTQEMRLSDVVRGLKVPNKVKLVSLNIFYTRREYIRMYSIKKKSPVYFSFMRPQTQRPQKEAWNPVLWHRKLKLLQWHHQPQGGFSSSEWDKIMLKILKWLILHFSVSLPRMAEESKCLSPQSVITSSTPTDSSPTGPSPAETQTTSSTSSLSQEELSSNTTTDLVWWGFIWSSGVVLCWIFCLNLFFF